LRLRLIASLFACACMLLGLAAVDAWVLLRPEPLSRRVQAALDRVFTTQFTLSRAQASLTDGLVVNDLIIADATGHPAIVVKELSAGVAWDRLGLGPVRVVEPTIWMRRSADGSLALADAIRPELLRGGDGGTPAVEIVIERASIRLADAVLYPAGEVVRLDNIDARIRLDPIDGVRVEVRIPPSARARWKGIRVLVHVPADPQDGLPEIRVEGRKIQVDDALRQLLPSKYRRLYDKLRPHGIGDVDLEVQIPPGDERAHLDGHVQVHGGGMRLVEFPYPVRDVTGRIRITTRRVSLVDLRGSREGGTYHCNGQIEINPPGVDDYLDLRIRAEGLPLDEDMAAALPPDAQAIYRRFAPRGRANGDVHIYGLTRPPGVEDDIHWSIDAEMLGIGAAFDEFPVPIEQLTGVVRIRDEEVFFEDVRGRVSGGEITAEGVADAQQVAVSVRGRGIGADVRLADKLRPEHAEILRRVRPDGLVDLDLEVGGERAPGEETLPVGFLARIWPRRGMRASSADFPYPLVVERGAIEVRDDGARIRDVRARGLGGGNPLEVRVDGFVAAKTDRAAAPGAGRRRGAGRHHAADRGPGPARRRRPRARPPRPALAGRGRGGPLERGWWGRRRGPAPRPHRGGGRRRAASRRPLRPHRPGGGDPIRARAREGGAPAREGRRRADRGGRRHRARRRRGVEPARAGHGPGDRRRAPRRRARRAARAAGGPGGGGGHRPRGAAAWARGR
jgi:hypothetical protein